MPSTGSVPAHSLEDCVIHPCHNFGNKRGGRDTTKRCHTCILAEIQQFYVNEAIRDTRRFRNLEVAPNTRTVTGADL